jgi:hypothetical protein
VSCRSLPGLQNKWHPWLHGMFAPLHITCIHITLCGSQAPELYVAPAYTHGTAADWFALGVTLHEFMVGCRQVKHMQHYCLCDLFPNVVCNGGIVHRPFDSKRIRACQKSPINMPLKSLDMTHASAECKAFISKLLCSQVNPTPTLTPAVMLLNLCYICQLTGILYVGVPSSARQGMSRCGGAQPDTLPSLAAGCELGTSFSEADGSSNGSQCGCGEMLHVECRCGGGAQTAHDCVATC